MTIIQALQTYLSNYTGLESGAPVWVNHLRVEPTDYSIVPLVGSRVISEDLIGNREMEFPFAFQAVLSTIDDLSRLNNVGFYEVFADWLDSQTEADILPVLDTGKEATGIQALGHGALFQDGESDSSGIYQIQCRLLYDQRAV